MSCEARGVRSPSRWPTWALLGGFLAILTIGGLAFARFVKLEERARLAENDAIARGISAFILAREES